MIQDQFDFALKIRDWSVWVVGSFEVVAAASEAVERHRPERHSVFRASDRQKVVLEIGSIAVVVMVVIMVEATANSRRRVRTRFAANDHGLATCTRQELSPIISTALALSIDPRYLCLLDVNA